MVSNIFSRTKKPYEWAINDKRLKSGVKKCAKFNYRRTESDPGFFSNGSSNMLTAILLPTR